MELCLLMDKQAQGRPIQLRAVPGDMKRGDSFLGKWETGGGGGAGGEVAVEV